MSHPALARLDHRPWPLQRAPWALSMTWSDLLFAHWPFPAPLLRKWLPRGLELEEHGGAAWVGVVPFWMEIRPRYAPSLPKLSRFPETNVRTYVTAEGKPGVWFFSLDAANALAVWGARRFFHLPYHRAKMSITRREGWVHYATTRRSSDMPVAFAAKYRPVGPVFEPRRGTFEHWLVERYCMYAAAPDGHLERSEIHHPPWPLQLAEAEIVQNSLLAPIELEPAELPLLHFAARQDVVGWIPRRIGTRSGG